MKKSRQNKNVKLHPIHDFKSNSFHVTKLENIKNSGNEQSAIVMIFDLDCFCCDPPCDLVKISLTTRCDLPSPGYIKIKYSLASL